MEFQIVLLLLCLPNIIFSAGCIFWYICVGVYLSGRICHGCFRCTAWAYLGGCGFKLPPPQINSRNVFVCFYMQNTKQLKFCNQILSNGNPREIVSWLYC